MVDRTRDRNYYEYGLSNKRVKELKKYCAENPDSIYIKWAARSANESIGKELLNSILYDHSYMVQADKGYMPIGEKDFYGHRRLVLGLLNEYLKHEYADVPNDDNLESYKVINKKYYDGSEELEIKRIKRAKDYFYCPVCGKTAFCLYKKENGIIVCEKCGKINKKIYTLRNKAYQLVEKKMRYYNWEEENPGKNIFQLMYVPRIGDINFDLYLRYLREYWALVEDFVEAKKEFSQQDV